MKKYLFCKHCKKMVEVIDDSAAKIICCGEEMVELHANTFDAASEKHIPVVVKNGNKVEISVGSVLHPMSEAHYITFIEVVTNLGSYRKELSPTSLPCATFYLSDDEEIMNVYAYCNLHSLWAIK